MYVVERLSTTPSVGAFRGALIYVQKQQFARDTSEWSENFGGVAGKCLW